MQNMAPIVVSFFSEMVLFIFPILQVILPAFVSQSHKTILVGRKYSVKLCEHFTH